MSLQIAHAVIGTLIADETPVQRLITLRCLIETSEKEDIREAARRWLKKLEDGGQR